nr:uncharacterized protein LOC110072789 [Pogona vitticeps]
MEAMIGVPSLPKSTHHTQTSPPPSPPRREEKGVETPDWGKESVGSLTLNKGVDTHDLEEVMKELKITRDPGRVLAGNRGVEIEAGVGDIREKPSDIPGDWEWVWMEDPWTHKWEQVRVPHEEAERRRQLGLKPRPSYWGETEAKEWRRKLREEREAVAQELERKKQWHIAELRKLGGYLAPGVQMEEMGPPGMAGVETKRHYR